MFQKHRAMKEMIHHFQIPTFSYTAESKTWDVNDTAKKLLMREDVDVHSLSQDFYLDQENNRELIIADKLKGYLLYSSDEIRIYQLQEKNFNDMKYEEMDIDLQAIFKHAFDVIYVANGEGVTVRVSSASQKIWGYSPEELEGQSIYKLEKEGVFRPSVVRLVLEKGSNVSAIQTTKTGRRLIILGVPIKDDDGNIVRVVNVSRDITEVNHLQKELQETKSLIEGYKEELLSLREKNGTQNRLIYRSAAMRKVVSLAKKAALSDSPIMITGEMGVGKRLLCEFIHNLSERSSGPLITLNCAAISKENFLEEINGVKRDSDDSGIHIDGKARNGTIIFENISELSIELQGILLSFIENNHDSVNSIRLMVTTKVDLYEMIKNNIFREDLYFLLNVFPIEMFPLERRKEDILPLCIYFLKQFNEEQKSSKSFSYEVKRSIEQYDWPGNVNELKNVVERMVFLSNDDILEFELLPDYIKRNKELSMPIVVNEIIPLKKAIELVEKLLLKKAMEQHKSTTKMAHILNVNQSNISRKLKKYDL